MWYEPSCIIDSELYYKKTQRSQTSRNYGYKEWCDPLQGHWHAQGIITRLRVEKNHKIVRHFPHTQSYTLIFSLYTSAVLGQSKTEMQDNKLKGTMGSFIRSLGQLYSWFDVKWGSLKETIKTFACKRIKMVPKQTLLLQIRAADWNKGQPARMR